jgi:hypothetical protein
MSAIFQRPVCDMGAAYDYALRPLVGEPEVGSGGPCDDRPRAVELCSAGTDPQQPSVVWRSFSLCPEHEAQLRRHDARLAPRGIPSRFRRPGETPGATPGPRR